MWLIIVVLTVVVILIVRSSNSKSKKETIEQQRFDEKYGINRKPRIEVEFSMPEKLFSEKPESKYSFEYKYQNYKTDVRYTVGCYTSKIKGLYHRHTEEIKRASELFYGDPLFLEKEPDNPVDRFAIKVKTWDGYCIGYIDSAINLKISRVMDECFLIKCFIYQAGYGEIPYQWAIIYTVKDKLQDTKITVSPRQVIEHTKIEPPKQNEVYLIDYKDKLKRLKENIKRSRKSADELCSKGKMQMYQNAIDRIKMYEDEIERIELLMKDIDINKIF